MKALNSQNQEAHWTPSTENLTKLTLRRIIIKLFKPCKRKKILEEAGGWGEVVMYSETETIRRDLWTSLIAQWVRIRLPPQGSQVRSLVWGDTCAARPVHRSNWVCKSRLLSPRALKPTLCNKRSHRSKKPVTRDWRAAPTHCHYRKKPVRSNKDAVRPINNYFF